MTQKDTDMTFDTCCP